jgi:hypothetical protein
VNGGRGGRQHGSGLTDTVVRQHDHAVVTGKIAMGSQQREAGLRRELRHLVALGTAVLHQQPRGG